MARVGVVNAGGGGHKYIRVFYHHHRNPMVKPYPPKNVIKASALAKQKAKLRATSKRSTRNASPAAARSGVPSAANPTAGAITRINTAPVAIGNSMKGARASVTHNPDGSVRLVGRDYALTCYSTGTVTNWELVGGFPLTPACFTSSVLRSFVQIYNKFRFNYVCAHYITSSPTSSNGDILMYFIKNRTDPIVNWTSSTFLPFAMSEPNAVLGPQWTNHSICMSPRGPTRTLDPGMNVDIDYQAQGEFLIFSKTSSTESAGYVLIDYDLTLSEMSVNPRAGILPNPNFIYQAAQLTINAVSSTAGSTIANMSTGTYGSGGTVLSTLDSVSTLSAGDVMKVVLDMTNTIATTWTVTSGTSPTVGNLFNFLENAQTETFSLVDGMTLYLTHGNGSSYRLYPTLANALTNTNPLVFGLTSVIPSYGVNGSGVPNAGIWLQCFVSYCCSSSVNKLQQQ